MDKDLKISIENELDEMLFNVIVDFPQMLGYDGKEEEIIEFVKNYIEQNVESFISEKEE